MACPSVSQPIRIAPILTYTRDRTTPHDHRCRSGVTAVPDLTGHFGRFGGRFAPEALMAALDELTDRVRRGRCATPSFRAELDHLLATYAGRPSLLTEAKRFGEQAGGVRVLLKREDLNHTGSHKINNVLGQALLTQRHGQDRA